jgi:hypothetical protein
VRQGGGWEPLARVLETQCNAEEARRAGLTAKEYRQVMAQASLSADARLSVQVQHRKAGSGGSFSPFGPSSLYARYCAAAEAELPSEQWRYDGVNENGPSPWAKRVVFPVEPTSPFWSSVHSSRQILSARRRRPGPSTAGASGKRNVANDGGGPDGGSLWAAQIISYQGVGTAQEGPKHIGGSEQRVRQRPRALSAEVSDALRCDALGFLVM